MHTDPINREIYELENELLDLSRRMRDAGYTLEDLVTESTRDEERIVNCSQLQLQNSKDFIQHFDRLKELRKDTL